MPVYMVLLYRQDLCDVFFYRRTEPVIPVRAGRVGVCVQGLQNTHYYKSQRRIHTFRDIYLLYDNNSAFVITKITISTNINDLKKPSPRM